MTSGEVKRENGNERDRGKRRKKRKKTKIPFVSFLVSQFSNSFHVPVCCFCNFHRTVESSTMLFAFLFGFVKEYRLHKKNIIWILRLWYQI